MQNAMCSCSLEHRQIPRQTRARQTNEAEKIGHEIKELFGRRSGQEKALAPAIHDNLATCWEEIIRLRLSSVERDTLLKKYPVMTNCIFLVPPKVNPEVDEAIPEKVKDRDRWLIGKQARLSACLAGVALELSELILSEDHARIPAIERLCDVSLMLADTFFEETNIRRRLIISALDSSWRSALRQTVSDEWLFSKNLQDLLKAFKVLSQSALDLKPKKWFGQKT